MKRLFVVKTSGGKIVDRPEGKEPWFDNKKDAKIFRDTLSKWNPRVSRGPDHRLGVSK